MLRTSVGLLVVCAMIPSATVLGHGTAMSPKSRVRHVFESNPENPSFALAREAVAIDGKDSYYNWNELSQNIPDAVEAGLPPGFDYSPWVPAGQLASGGRTPGNVAEEIRKYAGLDQVSADWPTTPVNAGETLNISYLATAPHDPSVWDVWMTTADWQPSTALNWQQMEFLGRADATLENQNYLFDVEIPANRSGHHVLWIAWQRDDPVGEVFFSASDLMVSAAVASADFDADNDIDGEDFLTWQRKLGTDLGPADLSLWDSQYPGASAQVGAVLVPEASSFCLLILGLLGISAQRRA